MLLDRAEKAGAAIEKTRVLSIERRERGWRLRTQHGVAEADFCIVATGARNPLREVGTEWRRERYHERAGLLRCGRSRDQIDIQFLPQLEGYIWVFPRCGHLSVGICGKGEPAQALRVRLENYMDERGIAVAGRASFIATCCRRSNRRDGATIAWRAMAGWRGRRRRVWSIRLLARVCITRCARATWRARVVLDDAHGIRGESGGVSRHPGAGLCRRSGVRLDAGAAVCSWVLSV